MSTHPSSDRLADARQMTVILRMLVDRQGRVIHGEIVDVNDNSEHRFKDLAGLTRVLRDWLVEQAQPGSMENP